MNTVTSEQVHHPLDEASPLLPLLLSMEHLAVPKVDFWCSYLMAGESHGKHLYSDETFLAKSLSTPDVSHEDAWEILTGVLSKNPNYEALWLTRLNLMEMDHPSWDTMRPGAPLGELRQAYSEVQRFYNEEAIRALEPLPHLSSNDLIFHLGVAPIYDNDYMHGITRSPREVIAESINNRLIKQLARVLLRLQSYAVEGKQPEDTLMLLPVLSVMDPRDLTSLAQFTQEMKRSKWSTLTHSSRSADFFTGLSWSNLLSFIDLCSEYNPEWAMAAFDWSE